MEGNDNHFYLKWHNYHKNLSLGFANFLSEDSLVDVTLAAEGQFLRAHRLVLSVCSPYFKELFLVHPSKHPIVILKDVKFKQLRALLTFMYRGDVNVPQDELPEFLKTADLLRIHGLADRRFADPRTQQSINRNNPNLSRKTGVNGCHLPIKSKRPNREESGNEDERKMGPSEKRQCVYPSYESRRTEKSTPMNLENVIKEEPPDSDSEEIVLPSTSDNAGPANAEAQTSNISEKEGQLSEAQVPSVGWSKHLVTPSTSGLGGSCEFPKNGIVFNAPSQSPKDRPNVRKKIKFHFQQQRTSPRQLLLAKTNRLAKQKAIASVTKTFASDHRTKQATEKKNSSCITKKKVVSTPNKKVDASDHKHVKTRSFSAENAIHSSKKNPLVMITSIESSDCKEK